MFNNSCHCFAYQHLTLFLKRRSLRSLVPSACSRLFLTSGAPLTVEPPPPCVGANRHLTCHRSVVVHCAQLDAWRMTHAHLALTRRLLPHYYRLQLNLSSPNFIVFHVHARARQSWSFLRKLTAQVSVTEEQPSWMTLTLSKTLAFPPLVFIHKPISFVWRTVWSQTLTVCVFSLPALYENKCVWEAHSGVINPYSGGLYMLECLLNC